MARDLRVPESRDSEFPVPARKFPVRLKKFPVMSFREFGEKARKFSRLGHMNRRFGAEFAKIPCFFPV